MMKQRLSGLLFVLCALLAGCAAASGDTDDLGDLERDLRGLNGMPPECLWQNLYPAQNVLLGELRDGAATAAIADDPVCGASLLAYMARAMAPAETATIADSAGRKSDYVGSTDIAPGWSAAPVSSDRQRYVLASLLAYMNGLHETVKLSLRGSLPALATTAAERADYGFEEGGFYGFVEYNPDPILVGCACYSEELGGVCGPVTSQYLEQRQGANQGWEQVYGYPVIRVMGACADVCKTRHKGFWEDCLCTAPDGEPRVIHEVITTYLLSDKDAACPGPDEL